MDVLVIVGDAPVPVRIAARAVHELRVDRGAAAHPGIVAELRGRIPRDVGVIGLPAEAAALATELHQAGLPVTLFTDADAIDVPRPAGVRVLPISDRGPTMEAAESLLDIVGNTPLVRLDR